MSDMGELFRGEYVLWRTFAWVVGGLCSIALSFTIVLSHVHGVAHAEAEKRRQQDAAHVDQQVADVRAQQVRISERVDVNIQSLRDEITETRNLIIEEIRKGR